MNKYFSLTPRDNLVPNSYVADQWDLKSMEPELFLSGRNISSWPNGVCLRSSTMKMDGELDDFVVNNAMLPVVTPRLKALIERMRTPTIQFFKILAYSSNGIPSDCYIANFCEHIPGLDLLHTKVFRHPKNHPDKKLRNAIQTMFRPTLVESVVKEWDFLRLEEFPERLFASSRFKREFNAFKMTGVSFSATDLS